MRGEAADLERDGVVLVESLIDGHGQLLVLVIDGGQRAIPPGTGHTAPRAGSNGQCRVGVENAQPGRGNQPAKLRGNVKRPVRDCWRTGAMGVGEA